MTIALNRTPAARLAAILAAVLLPLGALAAQVGARITVCTGCISLPVSIACEEEAGRHSHPQPHAPAGEQANAACATSVTIGLTVPTASRPTPAVPAALQAVIVPLADASASSSGAALAAHASRPPDPPLLSTVVLRI